MREWQDTEMESAPIIWAVGGGKGGVGKSVVSTILAFWLARNGKRTVLIDVDLGGANLHTLLGIKSPPRTLIDFINRKFGSLEEICIDTEAKNLCLISGSSEVLSLANPHFSQKVKLINHFSRLDADYVVIDRKNYSPHPGANIHSECLYLCSQCGLPKVEPAFQ